MPPKAKTPEEMALEREKIIKEAMVLVNKSGLPGLTMRKLATALKMSATNIYNYFENKDEIYLYILLDSFNMLHENISGAIKSNKCAFENLEIYLRTFIDFGVQYESRYELMFSTKDPKSLDYANTPSEVLATQEKEVAMKAYHLLYGILEELNFTEDKDEIWLTTGRIIAEVHGAINLHQTHILSETLNDPKLIFENLIKHILSQFEK